MESRAIELLELPDEILFAHGGCHVFALTLRGYIGAPLLWIRDANGRHDHLACGAGDGELADFFGVSNYGKYRSDEMLQDACIRFSLISVREVESKFVYERGIGYYAHVDFFAEAKRRAQGWIERHMKYFNGTIRTPIPGFSAFGGHPLKAGTRYGLILFEIVNNKGSNDRCRNS